DVFGLRVAFSRTRASDTKTACMVYDVVAMTLTEIAPVGAMTPMNRFGTVLGGNTVAFEEAESGNGDIMVFDMSTNGPLINVSNSMDLEQNPSLTPDG